MENHTDYMGKIHDLAKRMDEIDARRELVSMLGGLDTALTGINADGEDIVISGDKMLGLVLTTYQGNGYVRINTYDKDGYAESETFNGRWK